MFQHQIKAVHESVQEDKQRLDQNESDRRLRVTTHSPTLVDREGESDAERKRECTKTLEVNVENCENTINPVSSVNFKKF